MTAAAAPRINAVIARALAPRQPLTVSQWADAERILSKKGSAEPGPWRTSRNPPLREPMDCLSARSAVQDVVLKWPIQFGKTEVGINWLGYTMDHDPAPIMICLPGEVSMNKWIQQKLNPMLEETPAAQRALTSVASRDSANTRTFKDFVGGQVYLEHAGSPSRLKSTTVKKLIVDEVDEFANNLVGGDDPVEMLDGRTSSFPATGKRLYISTPQMQGTSRIDFLWEKSDKRRYVVPCPDCGHEQPLEWSGLQWSPDGKQCWYVCRECGVCIEEHQKTAMIAAGHWQAENPDSRIRGYHINCLYYPIGLGPRWLDLVTRWREAQGDPAKLKTFVNDRLAESWEDPAMRAVKHNVIADRAEPYALRHAPLGVLAVTAGVDTQDNRLAVHITGWGRGLVCWTLDYVELPGDPAEPAVWVALTDLLNRPIEHACGALIRVEATCIDAGGHRTEDVKAYGRSHMIRRPTVIFGAVPNNAPILSKGKLVDVTSRGRTDKRGVMIYHVGTVAAKHWLYARLSADADKKQADARVIHLSDELSPEYFGGLVSETYNPTKNRFEKRRGGPRNEPLDTWVYSYAATHHPELRLHRASKADWDAREARLLAGASAPDAPVNTSSRHSDVQTSDAPRGTPESPRTNPFASSDWLSRQ
jgi:phage terminase large subunit GpA-like protein